MAEWSWNMTAGEGSGVRAWQGIRLYAHFLFFFFENNQTLKMAQHDNDDKTCFLIKEFKESNKTFFFL